MMGEYINHSNNYSVDTANQEQQSYQWESYVQQIDTTEITLRKTLTAIEAT